MPNYEIEIEILNDDIDVEVNMDGGLSPFEYAVNAAHAEGMAREYANNSANSAELSAQYAARAKQYSDSAEESYRGTQTIANNFNSVADEKLEEVDTKTQEFIDYVDETRETLKGFSPIASVNKVGNEATITITDETGTTTATITDGAKGDKGDKGDDYILTSADKNAIANITANTLQPTITELDNVKADKTDIPTKTSELINDSTFTTKAYVDEEVSKATPTDYEQVKEDIALLKWKTLYLATEVVDSTEAYSKSVPANVYEKALLNKLGGKSVVVNQLMQFNDKVISQNGIETKIENGIITIQGVANASGGRNTNLLNSTFTFVKNHTYMLYGFYANVEIDFFFESSNYSIITTFSLTPTSKYRLFTFGNENIVCSHLGFNSVEGTQYNASGRIKLVDLTQLFGIGNEPTSTDDERIKLIDQYLEEHNEYNEGSIMSANVESVVSKGKNLAPISTAPTKTTNGVTFVNNGDGTIEVSGVATDYFTYLLYDTKPINLQNGIYTLGGLSNANNIVWTYLSFYDESRNIIHSFDFTGSRYDRTFEITNGYNIKYFSLTIKRNNNVATSGTITPFIVQGTSGTYAPYREPITKPISTIISKYFPTGMKSAGSVYDEIDIERGVAIQRVGSVDLGTLNYTYSLSSGRSMFYAPITDIAITSLYNVVINTLNAIYTPTTINATWVDKNICWKTINTNILTFINNAYSDVTSFKNAMNGVMLYYELATPLETPLDQADWEYLQSLEVESNGTITFANEQYLQVPNEESYLKRVE